MIRPPICPGNRNRYNQFDTLLTHYDGFLSADLEAGFMGGLHWTH